MDLNESQLLTVLQEAFTCYLAFLSYDQKIRESKLPRRGKGVETSADVVSQQYYQSRVAGTETCLQYRDRLAKRVVRWVSEPDSGIDDAVPCEVESERYESFFEEETPFLDPFTGAWIHPITPLSAGSSGRDDGAANKRVESPRPVQTTCLPKPLPVEEVEERTLEVKQIRPNYRPLTRKSLGIHPNIQLSISSIYKAREPSVISPKSSRPRKVSAILTESSSEDQDESDSEESDDEVEERNQREREDSSDLESTLDSSDSDFSSSDSQTSITSIMASALHAHRGSKDLKETPKYYVAEKERKENIRHTQALTQQLASRRAREENAKLEKARLEKARLEKARIDEALAKKLEREERAKEEQIKRDREVARRDSERFQAEELRKARHQKEKEAEERRVRHEHRGRGGEQHRSRDPPTKEEGRVSGTKEKHGDRDRTRESGRRTSSVGVSSPPKRSISMRRPSPTRKVDPLPKKTRFVDTPPVRRRSSTASHHEPLQRIEVPKKAEPTRKIEPPKKLGGLKKVEPTRKVEPPKKVESTRKPAPAKKVSFSPPKNPSPPKKPDPPKLIDCLACMEPGEKRSMTVLGCKHAYCTDCIKGAITSALKSHTAFKCCGTTILSKSMPALPSSLSTSYTRLLQELSTPNPKYCSSPACALFLPRTSIHGALGICNACGTRTCIPCSKGEHAGVCQEDKEGKKVEELAQKNGWKQCPGCKIILERTYGCLHMTCRCGREWCYACLKNWEDCGSSCAR